MHCSLRTQLVGRHALALDERRIAYEPELWDDDPRVRQRWFPGDQSDVGGGNLGRPASPATDAELVRTDTDLSYLSLLSICKEAYDFELDMDLEEIRKHEAVVRASVWQQRRGVSDLSNKRTLSSNSRIGDDKTLRRFTESRNISCDNRAFETRLAMMSDDDRRQYRKRRRFDLWDKMKCQPPDNDARIV